MARSIEKTSFQGWDAYHLRQDSISLYVVPSIGGRLMGIQYEGEEFSYINPNLLGQTPTGDTEQWKTLCGNWTFPLWGGGKTWLAPESNWPEGNPHPELDSGEWNVIEAWSNSEELGILVQSPICPKTNLQLSRSLSLHLDGSWTITQAAKNLGESDITFGLWDVLMLKRPGKVSIPLQAGSHSIHWMPEKGFSEELITNGVLRFIDPKNIQLRCDKAEQFKVGFTNHNGEITVVFHLENDQYLYQRQTKSQLTAPFAHGHPLEVFNSPALPYFEIESHSPLQTLAPNQEAVFILQEKLQKS
ncbi:DUF4380 domain-containing protein [Leeia sp. TBRC 13508]|uniref:DUF4380 domain-containing protein n=1 Tax=Leeia speluncae TaxID=2884804 RepID=A0ABS8D9V6_9NEIS|nr:DUF4380 domain-containing protein [Leeia speluncae]MCB6184989.1 DUF4380 domain-containing protein [Leeia speluncae]